MDSVDKRWWNQIQHSMRGSGCAAPPDMRGKPPKSRWVLSPVAVWMPSDNGDELSTGKLWISGTEIHTQEIGFWKNRHPHMGGMFFRRPYKIIKLSTCPCFYPQFSTTYPQQRRFGKLKSTNFLRNWDLCQSGQPHMCGPLFEGFFAIIHKRFQILAALRHIFGGEGQGCQILGWVIPGICG